MAAHWIAPVGRTIAPRVLIALAYDPVDVPVTAETYRTVAGSWTLGVSYRKGSEWVTPWPVTVSGDSTDAVWEMIEDIGRQRGRAYVVTRCASDTLTLAGFWGRVSDGSISLRLDSEEYTDRHGRRRKRRPHPLILSGTPDVIGWTARGIEYRAVSVGNHFAAPLLDVARAAGVPDPPAGAWVDRPTGHADPDSIWTADALLAVYRRAIDWWVSRGAGRWSDTVGAGAWQMWRTTLAPREVLEHDVPSATRLEVAAVYGGRAQLFWFGSAGVPTAGQSDDGQLDPARPHHLDGRTWKLDIRSMYAHLLREERYPVALSHRLRDCTPRGLRETCRHLCAVATCRVRCEVPRLPYHDPERGTVYPVGEWWTTLTTPEIVDSYERGELMEVGECWAYRPGTPFRAFADRLISDRQAARARGDKLSEVMCKSLVNALGGRLARTFRGWSTDRSRSARHEWGEWVESSDDGSPVQRCRGVAGVLQRYVTRDERAGGLTAMFAHLTAYGRVALHRIMETAGARSVLWCDTDGLIVTDAGLVALRRARLIGDDVPGMLRLEGDVGRFAARTPKHYQTDKGWTLCGARGDFSPLDRHRVRCYMTANPVRSGMRPDPTGIPTRRTVYELDAIPLSGKPGDDGWLLPPVVSGGRLIQPAPESERESGLDH